MSEWISVEDRLPENKQVVLVWVHYTDEDGESCQDVDFADFFAPSKGNQWFQPYAFLSESGPFVTHWMPLPAPPSA